MPSRADIDPVTMPLDLLPYIVLVEVVSSPPRFRYRVMGTAVAEMLGADWTGRFVDTLPGIGARLQSQYAQTANSGKPAVYFSENERYDSTLMQHKMLRYERLLLPLAGRGGSVSMLLGGTLGKEFDW